MQKALLNKTVTGIMDEMYHGLYWMQQARDQDCMWLRGLREHVLMASHSRKTQLNGRLRTAFENSFCIAERMSTLL